MTRASTFQPIWSPGGSFTVQKTDIPSPFPVVHMFIISVILQSPARSRSTRYPLKDGGKGSYSNFLDYIRHTRTPSVNPNGSARASTPGHKTGLQCRPTFLRAQPREWPEPATRAGLILKQQQQQQVDPVSYTLATTTRPSILHSSSNNNNNNKTQYPIYHHQHNNKTQ